MTLTATETSIRHQIVVPIPVHRAFALCTEQFDKIKPRRHNLMSVPVVESVFEARVGGSVYDRGEDGSICRWARVLAFDPPNGFVISWDIEPQCRIIEDPEKTSEVEVRFIAEADERTRVELQHRHLDGHGDGWQSERDGVTSEGGWPLYLRRFADLLSAA